MLDGWDCRQPPFYGLLTTKLESCNRPGYGVLSRFTGAAEGTIDNVVCFVCYVSGVSCDTLLRDSPGGRRERTSYG